MGAARLPRRCVPRNGRGPSTCSGRTGGSPSPQPSSIKGEGMSFDGLRTNGGGGRSEIAASPALLAMAGVLRRAQDERVGHPHPNPLPSRERGCPSTGSGRTGGSPSPQPSPIKGEGMSFDGLRMSGRAVGAARLPRRCAARNDRRRDGIATSLGFIRWRPPLRLLRRS